MMQRKPLGLIIFLSTVIALGGGLSAWAGYSQGATVSSIYADGQAILPGSLWTPMVYFVINDDAGIEDDPGDGPVFLRSVTVNFGNNPGSPPGTPSIQPGDIAAVAIAADANFAGDADAFDHRFDPIIAMTTIPEGELGATIFLPPGGRLAADADSDSPLLQTTDYFLLVMTSPTIPDSARFYPIISIQADALSPTNPKTSFPNFSGTAMHVVNNIGDLQEIREGVNDSGIPLVRFDRTATGEQPAYPPLYPIGGASHPDGFVFFGDSQGRAPEVWPAGSTIRPLLGLELAGGYDDLNETDPPLLTSLTLELISVGRREELPGDGVDNDGDQYLKVLEGGDPSDGIDETEVGDNQWENRNDDQDAFIDNPGPDGVWDINGIDANDTGDDPGVNGVFDVGIDFSYIDSRNPDSIPGQLDAYDELGANAAILAVSDERPVQKRLVNEDGDSYFDDNINDGINFTSLDFPIGFADQYDYGIDPIVLDIGIAEGVFDYKDEILSEGTSGFENLFRGDYISNDDGDYFMFDGWPRSSRVDGRTLTGPERFVGLIDEVYYDNPDPDSPELRFQLDIGDTMLYSGTNGWPLSFPSLFPDNDVLLFNDDNDFYIDPEDEGYVVGVNPVIYDSNGNEVYDEGDEITEDRDGDGVFDFGIDFVFHQGQTEGIDTEHQAPLRVPVQPSAFSATEQNTIIGYAFTRSTQAPPELWTPQDQTLILSIYNNFSTLDNYRGVGADGAPNVTVESPLNVPQDADEFLDVNSNYMIGYAEGRNGAIEQWSSSDQSAIVSLAQALGADLYQAALVYLSSQFAPDFATGNPYPRYLVFVADDPLGTPGVAEFNPSNPENSIDDIIYDFILVGNEPETTDGPRIPTYDTFPEDPDGNFYVFESIWLSASLYVGGLYDAGYLQQFPTFLVIVSDDPDGQDQVPDWDPENLTGSVDEIIYDNRILGNPPEFIGGAPVPRAELPDLYEDVDENGVYTPGDIVLYFGGVINDQGNIIPIAAADFAGEQDDPLIALLDEEPAADDAPTGNDGVDQDGDGENGPFDVADGIDNDEDSVDTDGDGYVDGLENLYGTNTEDPEDFPGGVDPVPYWVFIDEGIDEDTNFTPFGLGRGVDEFNVNGALIDEDGVVLGPEGNPILDEDGYPIPSPNGFDNDGDGFIDEDQPNFVREDIVVTELIDEEFSDGVDNDFDGMIDEDLNYVPLHALVDEELMDYFVDEEMTADTPEDVTLSAGNFDYVKAILDDPSSPYRISGFFGPRFDPVFLNPSPPIYVPFLEFQLSSEGDIPLDEYYVDFNGNGIYDTAYMDLDNYGLPGDLGTAVEHRQDECLWPGFDGEPSLRQGDLYGDHASPVDNDGDAEDNDGNLQTHPIPDGIDNDGDGLIDEGFNEDCGDSAFTYEDFELSGLTPVNHGFQVYLDNGDGEFDAAVDTLVSDGFNTVVNVPARGLMDYAADFPRTLVQISLTRAAQLETTDDFEYDFFVVMQTDDDDNDAGGSGATLKGLSYGDDWAVRVAKYHMDFNQYGFVYDGDLFPQSYSGINPLPLGRPTDEERTKTHVGRFWMNDIIGSLMSDGTELGSEPGAFLNGVPYIDATSAYLGVMGLNIATAPNEDPGEDNSGGQTGTEKLVSIRVNFLDVDLEGSGAFEPTDLNPLSDDLTSGVALFIDDPTAGVQGRFDYDALNDEPVDIWVPINEAVWDEDPDDPIVQAGGHYVVLKPVSGLDIPIDDTAPENAGYDFFVAVRTSADIDYHDAFQTFIRDGDVRMQNSRNEVNTRRAVDPIAANVPTFLSDLTRPSPTTGHMTIDAQSYPVDVIGLDLHDSNGTFNGQPSKIRSVRVYFDQVQDGTAPADNDFTPRDLLEVFWGMDNPYKQWSVFDPGAGLMYPYPSSKPGNIVSNNGVAIYRDMPNSDTNGAFDDPMDPAVIHPDVPVLLSGVEDWNYLGGFTYNVNLLLDPPRYEDETDVSAVDPHDPDPYETLPDSISGEFEGNDYFIVIRTSRAVSYGDNFRVGVRVETGNALGGTPPILFYPDLFNSGNHPPPMTPPSSMEFSFESLTTSPLIAPTVTVTSLVSLVGLNERHDASSDQFPVLGVNVYDDENANETLTGLRVELRSIDGLELTELRPLTPDETSGLALYADNPTGGINGQFDPTDILIPTSRPIFQTNYFADHPGNDGVLGTGDDPGTTGVFDPGIDEIYLDNGLTSGYLDIADTLVDDGDNDLADIRPGAQLHVLNSQPGIDFQVSAILRPGSPVDLPSNDLGENDGSDFFVVARTGADIDYLDRYRFLMSRDAVSFSGTRKSFASKDQVTEVITTNVPTYLEAMNPTPFTSVNDAKAVAAVNCVNTRPQPVTLRNLTLRFRSIGDNDFDATDLATIFTNLNDEGLLESGISIWRNTNGNQTFDYNPESPTRGDTFVPLARIPRIVGDIADPYSSFSVTLSLAQNTTNVLVPDDEPLESGIPDFFVVLKASTTSVQGDDFFIEILPGDVEYGLDGNDSFETLTTDTINFDVNSVPFFRFLTPALGAKINVEEATFEIEWSDEDVDSNAEINLFYFMDPDTEMVTPGPGTEIYPINPVPIFENDAEDSYDWDVSNITAEVYLRLLARVDDGVNEVLEEPSGNIKIFNEAPSIDLVQPATAEEVPEDTYTVTWIDQDDDNNARINLFLQPAGSSELIKFATNISENLDGDDGFYDVPIRLLREDGRIEPQVFYRVVATITDNVPRGLAGEIITATSVSDGSIKVVDLPRLEIDVPSTLTIVNSMAPIEYTATYPTEEAQIELYWIEGSQVGQIPLGEPLSEDQFPAELGAEQLIVSDSDAALDGEYLWRLLEETADGLEFKANIPVGKTVRLFGRIEDSLGSLRGIISEGRFRIDDHFIQILSPEEVTPSETASGLEPYPIKLTASSSDPNAVVDLYRDSDERNLDGILIAGGLSFTDNEVAQYEWDVTDVPLGSYFIYGVLRDDLNNAGDPPFADYSEGRLRVGKEVIRVCVASETGALLTSGGGILELQPNQLPLTAQIRSMELADDTQQMFLMDTEGNIYQQDGARVTFDPNFGWDVARDLEVTDDGQGMFVLDKLGGIKPLGKAEVPKGGSYFGWDIARDLEVSGDGSKYYLLDGYGGIHSALGATFSGLPYFSWDIARDLAMTPKADGMMVLDGFGGIHVSGRARFEGMVYFGWDVARDIQITPSGKGYYVMDAFGAVYGFGDANVQENTRFIEGLAQDSDCPRAILYLEMETLDTWDLDQLDSFPDVDPATTRIVDATGAENNWVLWTDNEPGQTLGRDIRYYNTETGQTGLLVRAPQTQDNPAIDGNMAVWNTKQTGDWDIYLIDDVASAVAAGDAASGITDLATGVQFQQQPDISKGVVVWQEYRNNNWDIFLVDANIPAASRTVYDLSSHLQQSDQTAPTIYATAPDATTGLRDVFVGYVDNQNGNSDLNVVLFSGSLDEEGKLAERSDTAYLVGFTGNQFEPDLGYNRFHSPGVLVLSYSDDRFGDLNVFFESLDITDPSQPSLIERRTIPSAAQNDVPRNINPQFGAKIGSQRIGFIDRRSGFWDVYIHDFQVRSLRQNQPDGEIRLTDTQQKVTELATDGDRVIWVESEGNEVRLMSGTLTIEDLMESKVFSSARSDRLRFLETMTEKGMAE